jgi:hypothetical protein
VESILTVMVGIVIVMMQQLDACLEEQQSHSKQKESTGFSYARTHCSEFPVRPFHFAAPCTAGVVHKKARNYPSGTVAGSLVPGLRSDEYPIDILNIYQRGYYSK